MNKKIIFILSILTIILVSGCVQKEKLETTQTEVKDCVGEGESFLDAPPGSPYYTGSDKVTVCCDGLEKRDTYEQYSLPKCILNKGSRYVCIKSGDGICDSGENNCNSLEDCK